MMLPEKPAPFRDHGLRSASRVAISKFATLAIGPHLSRMSLIPAVSARHLIAALVIACGGLGGAPALGQSKADIDREAGRLARAQDLQTELPAYEPPSWFKVHINRNVVEILVWVAVGCGVVVLLYYLRDMLPGRGLGQRSQWDETSELSGRGPTRTDEAAQVEADELARQGRFVEAMHVLLLQGLNEMRKRLDLRFADSLTSREIVREANVPSNARTALRDIIGWVERAYFGTYLATANDYLACRQSFTALSDALQGSRPA
jgi:hypothetical protein